MCENVRNRRTLKFVRDTRTARNLCSSPLFNSVSMVNSGLLQFLLYPQKIVLNRPIQIGVSFTFLKIKKIRKYPLSTHQLLK